MWLMVDDKKVNGNHTLEQQLRVQKVVNGVTDLSVTSSPEVTKSKDGQNRVQDSRNESADTKRCESDEISRFLSGKIDFQSPFALCTLCELRFLQYNPSNWITISGHARKENKQITEHRILKLILRERGRQWRCRLCGKWISISRGGSTNCVLKSFYREDLNFIYCKKKRGLRHVVSNLFKSWLTPTPELPEPSPLGEEYLNPVENEGIGRLKPSVTKLPAQDNENSADDNLRRLIDSNRENCEAVEYRDSNGSYLVIEQRFDNLPFSDQSNNNSPEEGATESSGSSDRSENSPLLTSQDPPRTYLSRNNSFPTKTVGFNNQHCHSNHSSPVQRSASSASQWSSKSSTNSAPAIGEYASDIVEDTVLQDDYSYTDIESLPISFKARNGTLYLPLEHMAKKGERGSIRKSGKKKRRSGSWINILSPSYKQKNDDFHKFFKDLPDTERLLVDYACAVVKDILIQGRLYVSQNYVCFRSNILKWQTRVTFPLKDIICVTKEKTVKVIPNAIQFQVKTRGKFTFTSFTARDRVYMQINKLIENALQDKPMTPQELWSSVHDQYGSDLGCSSDEDYVKPIEPVFDYSVDASLQNNEAIEFGKKKQAKKQPKKMDGRVLSLENNSENGNSLTPSDQSNGMKPSLRESDSEYVDFVEEEDEEENTMDVDSSPKLPPANEIQNDEEFSLNLAFSQLKKLYLLREYDISATDMFKIIFDEACPFWLEYLQYRGGSDISVTKWAVGTESNKNNKVRNLDYNVELNNPLGPKTAQVEETQVQYNHAEDNGGVYYAVDCIAKTLGIPYSDYFSTVMRYSIRQLTSKSCELRISAEIKFRKTPWGLVKNFIEKNAYSGIEENFVKLEKELDLYLDQQKDDTPQLKSLRQRRSVSSTSERRSKSLSSMHEVPSSSPADDELFESETNSLSTGDNQARFRKHDVIAAPCTAPPVGHKKRDLNNNNRHARGSAGSKNDESKSRRYFYGAFIFIFALLLLSNYSLYQRLNALEQFQFSKTFQEKDIGVDVVDNLVTDGDRFSDNLRISGQLTNLERRLAQLEDIVQSHVTSSQSRWHVLTSEWKELQRTISHIMERVEAKWKT